MNTSWTRSALAAALSTLLAACNGGGGSGSSYSGTDSNTPDTNKQPPAVALTPVDFNRLADSFAISNWPFASASINGVHVLPHSFPARTTKPE